MRQEVGRMQMWKKVAIGAVSALTIAGGANLAAMAAGSDDSPAVVDVKGPCDEAEHANDARCAAPQVLEDQAGDRQRGDDRGREQERRDRDTENQHEADDRDGTDAEHEAEDNSGPGSENEGPSDRSGSDDGADHDRGDDHGGDD
jgi:hypothetical protein